MSMQTKVLPTGPEAIRQGARLLRQGKVVAIPTETVYGLAANALQQEAVAAIFAAKGRPQDNPLIAHIADMDMLPLLVREVCSDARRLAECFWPGPLTMVLPRTGAAAPSVSAGLDTIGIRMPAHETARRLIREAGVPLAAPSANLSGSPSPTTARHVLADMDGRIPLIIDGGDSPVGVESTVVSLCGGEGPVLLRPGFVTSEEMEEVLGRPVVLSASIEAAYTDAAVPASPGVKYRHYAPNARVTIVEAPLATYAAYLGRMAAEEEGVFALCFEGEQAGLGVPAVTYGQKEDAASQAAALFTALRTLDERGAKNVYARPPGRTGIALAVRNRLLRAASFRVVTL